MYYRAISYCRRTVFAGILLTCLSVVAQDPSLPPTNLGLANMQDGNPPGPGVYYQSVFQVYNAEHGRDRSGTLVSGMKLSTLLSMQQFIVVSKLTFLGGNLGGTALLPIIKIIPSDMPANQINPSVVGDLIIGPTVQWFDKHIGTMPLKHRLELDLIVPVGGYSTAYTVNPSAHLYTMSLHHTFTIFPTERFSVSMRNIFNYNFRELGTQLRPGMFYNNNYSLEYKLSDRFRVEGTGYYLQQLEEDSYMGNKRYFREEFGLDTTKERVFAYGLGIGYVTPGGAFLELKAVKETAVINRTEGYRATLLLNIRLD